MDNLTHSLVGAALAKTGLGAASRFTPVGMVIAANIPDADIVVRLWGGLPLYLAEHRGITHSLAGVAMLTALLGLAVWALERRAAGKNGVEAAPPRLGGIMLAIGAALLSHPLLDSLNTYGVRPFLPFDGTWYYGDLTFIVDPWQWLIYGAAAALAGRRTSWGSVLLGLVAALQLFAVLFSSRSTLLLQLVFPGVVLAIGLLRWGGFGRRRANTVVLMAAALTAVHLGLAWRHGGQALRVAVATMQPELEQRGERIERYTCSPAPAERQRWGVVLQTGSAVYWLEVRGGQVQRPAVRADRNLELAELPGVAGTAEYRAWQVFARHPYVTKSAEGAGELLLLRDARYEDGGRPGWPTMAVRRPAARAALAEAAEWLLRALHLSCSPT